MINRHIYFVILGFLVTTTVTRTFAEDSSIQDSNILDPALKLLALQLFKDTSNTGLFSKVLATFPDANNVHTLPNDRLGRMYRDYNNKQIEALERELAKEETQIYHTMRIKTQQIKVSWRVSIKEYENNGDIKTFENKFLKTGNNLVSLQKLVIRVVNSFKDKNGQKSVQKRQGKNVNQCVQYFQNYFHLFERSLIGKY